MTLGAFKAATLPSQPPDATHAAGSVPHIYTKGDSLSSFSDGGVAGLALGISASTRAPRDRSCARRERWGQLGFRADARGESGCRRSYARSGPVPLPLRGGAGILGEDEAFGVPQRGSAYQPGVKPRGDGVGPSHLHKRGQSFIFLRWLSGGAGAGDQCLDGGSAGSVLRSQGTLGPVGLSRGRARGIRVSTFLCSLRPGPAAASWRRRKARGR